MQAKVSQHQNKMGCPDLMLSVWFGNGGFDNGIEQNSYMILNKWWYYLCNQFLHGT